MSIIGAIALHGVVALGPAGPARTRIETPSNAAAVQGVERLPGFAAMVTSHIVATIGLQALPGGDGFALDPGLFVTMGLDRVQAFDRDIAVLAAGRPADGEAAHECANRCPAALFDAFSGQWLALAIEATQRAVEIPNAVVFAAPAQLPASTLLATVYAAAASRPLRPPSLALVLSSSSRGLRGQPFYVLPPQGLELGQGSAVLALQVRFGNGRFELSAEDGVVSKRHGSSSLPLQTLRATVRDVKKRHPGKEAIILVPGADVSVAELVEVMIAVREDFPRIVLSMGQDLIVR